MKGFRYILQYYNHQGSVALVTNMSGRIQQHLQYLPYGGTFVDQHTSSFASPFTFSAKEKDSESGYNYFGARYYTDNIMMWLSVDPMSDERPWISPYNYCQWNPIGRVDTWGMLDDHYFDEDGNYLGDDGEGNAIRIISRSSFDLQTNNGEYVTSDLKEVSLLFSDHVESHGMSEKAQLNVYKHYNTTDLDVEKWDGGKNNANMGYNKTRNIMQVNLEKNFNQGISDNYDEITNSFVHEGQHYADRKLSLTDEEREGRAIKAQMEHESWQGTRQSYKDGVYRYAERKGVNLLK